MRGAAASGCRPSRIVHVIEQLRPGGPVQALIGFCRDSTLAATTQHRVVSLLPPDARAVAAVERIGIAVAARPDTPVLQQELTAADIVQVHFWNNPTIHAWMSTDLPAMRVLIWCHVNGQHGPHVLPRSLFTFGDLVAATSPASLDLPAFQQASADSRITIPAGADFSRLVGLQPQPQQRFTVGYLGTLDFTKLHPEAIPLSAAVRIDAASFHFCGDGNDMPLIKQQARQHGMSHRCRITAYQEDIAAVLATYSVFGYPLRPHTYCTSELALQEAMAAGIPPVVFPHGGLDRLVDDGKTGLVVQNTNEYPRAIEWLFHHPAQRRRLGEHAAREARRRFGSEPTAFGMAAAYNQLLTRPKRERRLPPKTGAAALLASLDTPESGPPDSNPFVVSIAGHEQAAFAAEEMIAGLGPVWRHVLLQYRVAYPTDPHLRLWSGLVLSSERPALAAMELRASEHLGLASDRIRRHRATRLKDRHD